MATRGYEGITEADLASRISQGTVRASRPIVKGVMPSESTKMHMRGQHERVGSLPGASAVAGAQHPVENTAALHESRSLDGDRRVVAPTAVASISSTRAGSEPADSQPSHRPRATIARFDWADTLLQQLHVCALPEPVREWRFDPKRRWRFDLAWVDRKIACEIDGSEWTQGRHGRGAGMQSDCEKLNAALLAGWQPYRFVGSQVRSGHALSILEKVLR